MTTIIQHNSGSPSYCNERENKKINKRNLYCKRNKTLTVGNMILYIGNPKDTIRKLLELICEFSKVARYKIQRNHLHSYTLTMKNQEEKLRNQSHLPLQQQKIKYLGINLPKETKDLYTENCKTRMKEIKHDKQMERDSRFLAWKNQYCENDYTTKCDL